MVHGITDPAAWLLLLGFPLLVAVRAWSARNGTDKQAALGRIRRK